jgi:hypothetical protein
LKTKTFISQKSLDTPVFGLIRFAQKVLTDFQAPLELFSLEEEATLLPGGLFVSLFHFFVFDQVWFEVGRFRWNPFRIFYVSSVVGILCQDV